MVRLESAAVAPGAHSSSQDLHLDPIQISRQKLIDAVQQARSTPLESSRASPLVKVFVQRQPALKQSGSPQPQHLKKTYNEESDLDSFLIPRQVLLESLQMSRTSSLESSKQSDFVQILVPRHVLPDSTHNNQTPPPENPLADEVIHALKAWWTTVVAIVIVVGNRTITCVKRAM